MRGLVVVLCATACSAKASERSSAFKRIPDGLVVQLDNEYCGQHREMHDQPKDLEAFDVPPQRIPKSPALLSCSWEDKSSSASIELQLAYDRVSSSIVFFHLTVSQLHGPSIGPVADSILTKYVEPWLAAMPGSRLRSIIESSSSVRGDDWLVAGTRSTSSTVDTLGVRIDAWGK